MRSRVKCASSVYDSPFISDNVSGFEKLLDRIFIGFIVFCFVLVCDSSQQNRSYFYPRTEKGNLETKRFLGDSKLRLVIF